MKHSAAPIHPNQKSSPQRGSTLILVIVMTAVLGLLIASVLGYNLTEARLNQSDLLHAESRQAAEATVNHGMAQLRQRFDHTRQISPSEMNPQRQTALALQPGFRGFMAQSRAIVPSAYTRPATHQEFLAADTIVGGLVMNQGRSVNLRIDPLTPLPEDARPGAPTHGQLREVQVFAKATVDDPAAGRRTAFARQSFQVVDRSLFQNAVLFNGLLEIFPGGDFRLAEGNAPVVAPVVYIGNNVRVFSRVEAGSFHVGRYGTGQGNVTMDALLMNYASFNQNATNLDPFLVRLTTANPGDGPLETGVSATVGGQEVGFRELALQRYAGGLLTAEHGIVNQGAPGLEFLREWGLEEAENAGDDFNFPTGHRFAGQFDQGEFDRRGDNWGHHLIAPSRGMADLDAISDPEERRVAEALNTLETSKFSTRSALVLEFNPDTDEMRMFYQTFQNDEPEFFGLERVRNEIDINVVFPDPHTRFWEVSRFERDENDITGGIQDFRQGRNSGTDDRGEINLVRIDVERLRAWVEEEDEDGPTFRPEWWNGGVFVHMPEAPADPNRRDRVIGARSDWAIQLFNGRTIPNRQAVDTNGARGMTFATNSALYVQGSFNAPGGANWDASTFGTEQGAEAPAALVADAITLLSDNWDNVNSAKGIGSRTASNRSDFSAALIMGNVPSQRDRGYSGGLENFPRFLEQWGNSRTAAYRGSLIRLFRSESHDAPWPGTGNTYSAPNREWSFHTGFREFTPPLDMGQRTFRRIFFRELTEAEFREQTAALFEQ